MEAALERAAEREELLTRALERELPAKLRARLQSARDQAMNEANDLEAVREREQALDLYREVIDQALARAPHIDRRINRLPRTYPDRIPPRHPYFYPDIYSPIVESLRSRVHREVERLAPDATFHDRVPRYFDTQLEPYAVEACFVLDAMPLRLHVVVWTMQSPGSAPSYSIPVTAGFSLLTLVRKSVPSLSLEPEAWHRSLLKALRLKNDVIIGDTEVDRLFIIDGDRDEAQRVLREGLCAALLEMARVEVPRLAIGDGLARLEWRETVDYGSGIDPACAVLRELRAMPPTPLLSKRASRTVGSSRAGSKRR
jgi:hypothetical protein